MRFPALTRLLAGLAQWLAIAALSVTVLPWFLGVPGAPPVLTVAAVALGVASGHLAAHTRLPDNRALGLAVSALAVVLAVVTPVVHQDLGHAAGWGVVAAAAAFAALLFDRAATADLVRRHVLWAAAWACLGLLLGSLGSPYGALAGNLALLALPTLLIAYAAIESARRTGRPAARESLAAALVLAAAAVLLVLPAVRSALGAAVQGLLYAVALAVSYIIFWPLSWLVAYVIRLLRRREHGMRAVNPAAFLGRHTARGHAIAHAAHGLPAALWAVLGVAALVALALWAVGRGRPRQDDDQHTYRESVRPLAHTAPHRRRRLPPPPGVRRAYAMALASLDRAGLLAVHAHPAATPDALLETLSKTAEGSQAGAPAQDDVTLAVRAFARLTELYCQAMYGSPHLTGEASGVADRNRKAYDLAAQIRAAVRTHRPQRGHGSNTPVRGRP